jgi:hypothetical protein
MKSTTFYTLRILTTDFSHNHVNAPTLSDDESVLSLSAVFDHSEPLIFDIKVIQETHQWEDLDAFPQLEVAVFIPTSIVHCSLSELQSRASIADKI